MSNGAKIGIIAEMPITTSMSGAIFMTFQARTIMKKVHHDVKLALDANFVFIFFHSPDFDPELEAINYARSVRAPGPGRAILS